MGTIVPRRANNMVKPIRFEFAEQYSVVCIIIKEDDTADDIINLAIENDATFFDGEDLCYCVRFPDRPQELYTASALRRSLK